MWGNKKSISRSRSVIKQSHFDVRPIHYLLVLWMDGMGLRAKPNMLARGCVRVLTPGWGMQKQPGHKKLFLYALILPTVLDSTISIISTLQALLLHHWQSKHLHAAQPLPSSPWWWWEYHITSLSSIRLIMFNLHDASSCTTEVFRDP